MYELYGNPAFLAAYNAGPGRAKRWLGTGRKEGAIYAETIPITETRDYVKKVMANSVLYGMVLNGHTPSLSKRLGKLVPSAEAAALEADDAR